MMTDTQRCLMHARQKVESFLISPIQELLDATLAAVAAEKSRADDLQEVMDTLRPVWAQGFTSDSEAAQSSGNALAEIWKILGVTDQTAAMEALRAYRADES